MSTPACGATGAAPSTTTAPSLLMLPDDVLVSILDRLSPQDIASFSLTSTDAALLPETAPIWPSAARRHLAIAPSSNDAPRTAADVRALADTLLFRWWVLSGLLVPGVPTHRRSGFSDVFARGGIEVAINDESCDSCYVFGGRFADSSVPALAPAVVMTFAVDPAGPFPVDGLVLRIVHAAEPLVVAAPDDAPAAPPRDDAAPCDDASKLAPASSAGPGPSSSSSSSSPSAAAAPSADVARVLVRLNDTVVANLSLSAMTAFEELICAVAPDAVYTRPRHNVLSVEYERSSALGYWVRDVRLQAAIVPLPVLSERERDFPVASATTTMAMTPETGEADQAVAGGEARVRHAAADRGGEEGARRAAGRPAVGRAAGARTRERDTGSGSGSASRARSAATQGGGDEVAGAARAAAAAARHAAKRASALHAKHASVPYARRNKMLFHHQSHSRRPRGARAPARAAAR